MTKTQTPYYAAQDILSRRDHAEFEVRTKMRRKGFSAEDIDDAIGRLKERQLLDDEAFAQSFVDNTLRFKAVGPYWLIHKLQQKGVAPEFIEPAVYGAIDDAREIKLAREAASQWRRSHSQHKNDRQRLTRFLISRGFSSQLVIDLLNTPLS